MKRLTDSFIYDGQICTSEDDRKYRGKKSITGSHLDIFLFIGESYIHKL